MGWSWGTSATGAQEGGQIGYNVGGPWGAAAGAVIGGVTGGLLFGSAIKESIPDPIAGMSQSEWDWYKQNVVPQQQKMLRYATDPNAAQRNVQQAESQVKTQYANLPEQFQNQMLGRGVKMTQGQTDSLNKSSQLNEGISEVGAANRARSATYAQQQGILMRGH